MRSRKQNTLTINKLDVSIFQFKDRPIMRQTREMSPLRPSLATNFWLSGSEGNRVPGGFSEELKQTRPAKRELARVEETDFTIDESVYKQASASKDDPSSKPTIRESIPSSHAGLLTTEDASKTSKTLTASRVP